MINILRHQSLGESNFIVVTSVLVGFLCCNGAGIAHNADEE
jgi:hypothetical protein